MEVDLQFHSSSSYRLKEKIGAGGCAEVFLYARQTAGLPEQEVVIKVVKSPDEATFKELLNEGRRLDRLKHPNILAAFGYEKMGNSRFGLVLEYIPGENLKNIIPRIPAKLRQEMAVYIIGTVAEAIAAAHAQHIIHGDMSARNILISESGQIKLSDFGLARRISQAPTSVLTNKGSMDYLAPERWRGQGTSLASDVFALGILTYEILTGANPLQGASQMEGRKLSETFLKMRPWEKFPLWKDFFDGALATEPENRVPASELLDSLPHQPGPILDLQKRLADCVHLAPQEFKKENSTQSLTCTILLQSWAQFRRSTSPLGVQILVTMAFIFFLVIPGAIGMDHGASVFLRPYLLTLTSDPWGEVFIDGKSQGFTPLLNVPVSSGNHHLIWRGRGGETVRRNLMAFPNGSAAFQIVKKKGQALLVAPILRNI